LFGKPEDNLTRVDMLISELNKRLDN